MISRALARASAIGNVNVVDAAARDILSARSRGFMDKSPAQQRRMLRGLPRNGRGLDKLFPMITGLGIATLTGFIAGEARLSCRGNQYLPRSNVIADGIAAERVAG